MSGYSIVGAIDYKSYEGSSNPSLVIANLLRRNSACLDVLFGELFS